MSSPPTNLAPIIVPSIVYRYYVPFDSWLGLNGYSSQWYMDQQKADLAIAEYSEYWTDRTEGLVNTLDGAKIILQTLDYLAVNNPSALTTALFGYAYYDSLVDKGATFADVAEAIEQSPVPEDLGYSAYDYELNGSWASPYRALAHYFFGDGEDLTVDINNLGLVLIPDDITINGENLFESLLQEDFVGTRDIVFDRIAIDTSKSHPTTGTYIGNMTIRIEGSLTKFSNGEWEFVGEAKGYNDTYDFNSSTHREWYEEILTNVVDFLPGLEYDIAFQNSLPVHWNDSMDFFH